MLRGPYLINGEGNVYIQYKGRLLPLDELKEGLAKGGLLEATKELDKVTKKFETGFVDLIGIQLSNGSKVTRTGLIYSARMVDYGKICGRRNEGCSIIVEVLKASDSLKKALESPKIIRLGGEGRLVKVMTGELQPVSKFVGAEEQETKRLRLYVTTPLLFEASPSLVSKEVDGFETGTTYLDSRLNGKVSIYLTEVGLQATAVNVVGSLGIIGGFSVARALRKPVYAALQPGSVIEISRNLPFLREEYSKVYSAGLGLFRDLGYGTVIPIPTADQA